jgi:endonuclease YncB( thermonuclease family)
MSLVALVDATDKIPAFTLAGTTRPAKVVSCYDGDTFEAVMSFGDQIWKFDCRMVGYDSPEIKPLKSAVGREAEKLAALRAKIALLSFVCDNIDVSRPYTNKDLDALVKLNKRIIQINCKEFDKYGRVLVEIPIMNQSGGSASGGAGSSVESVNQWMVKNGYGYEYTGGTKKPWAL